jgi:hypothetical protein
MQASTLTSRPAGPFQALAPSLRSHPSTRWFTASAQVTRPRQGTARALQLNPLFLVEFSLKPCDALAGSGSVRRPSLRVPLWSQSFPTVRTK